jgi:soluble lytic murein transglycosylase-like protein
MRDMVTGAAIAAGVEPALALAVTKAESGFRPGLVSSAGARGPMQILPGPRGPFPGYSKEQLDDPQTNVTLGTKYLKRLVDHYGPENTEAIAAAYNGGEGNVSKRGIGFNKENRDYVRKVSENLGVERERALTGHAVVHLDIHDRKTGNKLAETEVPLSSHALPTTSPSAVTR